MQVNVFPPTVSERISGRYEGPLFPDPLVLPSCVARIVQVAGSHTVNTRTSLPRADGEEAPEPETDREERERRRGAAGVPGPIGSRCRRWLAHDRPLPDCPRCQVPSFARPPALAQPTKKGRGSLPALAALSCSDPGARGPVPCRL